MSSVLRMLQPPLLSKQRGCVAAWHAGGLYGPSLIGAQLRDFISNTHHAQFGSTSGADSNDPLQLLPERGLWYVYFPGTSGNSATLTLANSTTYDYTITYSDGTTAEGTQSSTGAGLVTLGGTDVLFAGLKVRRVLIVPDGGGATVADIDFSQRSLWNAARTSLTAVTGGQTVTINRTTSASKTAVVDRPLIQFGLDDYLQIPNHADLNFVAGTSLTAAIAFRTYATPLTRALFGNAVGFAEANVGWAIGVNSAGVSFAHFSDGTVRVQPSAGTVVSGTPSVVAISRDPGSAATTHLNGTPGTPLASVTASISNSEVVRIGANNAASPAFWYGEFFAAALFRRALSGYEIRQLNRELLGVPI